MLSRLRRHVRKESFGSTGIFLYHRPASTLPWNNPAPVVLLQPEENEEEHNMSALFEYFSLFDFFIVAALVGIFCCGLLDGETS
jgi:hypothetical protein